MSERNEAAHKTVELGPSVTSGESLTARYALFSENNKRLLLWVDFVS